MRDENKYALLIDAENVSSKYIDIVTKEAQTGQQALKIPGRILCWKTPCLRFNSTVIRQERILRIQL